MERLEDVDQGAATFVDSAFEHATPVGGDWAGWSPPAEDPAECVSSRLLHYVDSERPTDSRAFALELQKRRTSGTTGICETGARTGYAEEKRASAIRGTTRDEKRRKRRIIKRKKIV